MKKRFRALMGTTLAASMTLLAACGGGGNSGGESSPGASSPGQNDGQSSARTTTITHVVNGDSPSRDTWIKAIADAVGVNVDIQVLPNEQFEQIYKVKAGTNDLPDMINYHPGARTRDDLRAADKLVDLSDLPLVQNIFEDILPYYQESDGKVYGVPSAAMRFGGIAYNKKVFADAGVAVPQSLDELIAAAEKLKAAGVTPFYLSAKDSWTLQIPGLAAFSYDQLHSPGILDRINSNQATFAEATNFIQAYDTVLELLDKGYINSDYLSATYANGQQALAEGTAAMYPVLSAFYGTIMDNYPDKLGDMGFFAWPVAGEKAVTIWPPMIYGIPNESSNQDEVKKFIEYFASDEGQTLYFEHQPAVGVPAYKGIQLDESKLLEPVKDMIQVSESSAKYATMDFSVVVNMGAFGEQVQEILLKVKEPADLADYLTDTLSKNAKSAGIAGF
ncbi:ABC transporter substrate-binding protein [Paenibacillaceae bacterium WGS1546]|uniref:ABC transporter substrate-binding protein n=1 Tax=Cohnella sp. WGS1546 TaxID=3366810 RepID=UPI00372D1216